MSIINKNDLSSSSEGWADLHIHTNFSDGIYSPEEVIEKAAAKRLRAIGITDHDAIGGVRIAQHVVKKNEIEVIPGIELSTMDNKNDIHILGYLINIENEQIQHYIKLFQDERLQRAKKILTKLRSQGIKLNMDIILEKSGTGSIGRPHIAEALMEEGFVLSYDEAFYRYLGDGKPAYVPKYKITPEEGIQLIHSAKGLAFVAHPGVDIATENLLRYIKLGLDGIEILHPKHNQGKVNELYQFAIHNGLLVSGGSDCHGDRKGYDMLGMFNVPYRFVMDIKEKHKKIQKMQSMPMFNIGNR